ncbi:YggS family pyridoxal phosphate-dependent enzyme [Cyclobacterium amurskyense]|uniref:Pyridoxal phosphate homeostasis protein n=1 Tax=Cyclobacterium amurskyense TaxID=320787 RepID=A0A0H4P762_9BACT|nr:YggS family pyridoxal phosphate-dependent enzyme [Cyclobacterium amurskyense]AKP50301.1 Pyridoxal phosphate enzyme, YggS family [Cyclobacterium amurskyense]
MQKTEISQNLKEIKATFLNPDCLLVAVSKTKPISAIQQAYEAGIRDFGENKVQEITEKASQLPDDIKWHMIGHLQRNKVKFIAPFIHLIHSVDSLRLLKQINKEAEKVNRTINCLLQVYIANEETKFGWDKEELYSFLLGDEINSMNNIQIVGLMGMATNTSSEEVIREEFKTLKNLHDTLKKLPLPKNVEMREISMGMSSDYLLAQQEGSTMVRIGSAIFGFRNYN